MYSPYCSVRLCVLCGQSVHTERNGPEEVHEANKDGCVNESTDAVWLEARELCLGGACSGSPALLDELPVVAFTGRDWGGTREVSVELGVRRPGSGSRAVS